MEDDRNTNYLSGVSELAGHSFASTQESLEAMLKLIVEHLELRSSYVTHIVSEECRNEVLMAHNSPGGSDIPNGAQLELPGTF